MTYPGLPASRYRPLVDKYLPLGAGAIFSFDCQGGREAGQDFIRGLSLWSHLANVGDAKSLVIHPASTTHRQLSDDELRAAGVGPGTIRLSVGIESVDDLIWDLEQGFASVRAAAAAASARRRRDDARIDAAVRPRPLSGSAGDPAGAAPREDHRRRRPVAERAARQLLRRLLPEAARLHGHPGEPARAGDPREQCYPSLADVPVPIDVVNVFRAPDALPAIAEEAVKVGAGCLWCQFGVINEAGARIAEAGGVTVVMDRCLKVEHARYAGRMHWLGFNTHRITSVRGELQ